MSSEKYPLVAGHIEMVAKAYRLLAVATTENARAKLFVETNLEVLESCLAGQFPPQALYFPILEQEPRSPQFMDKWKELTREVNATGSIIKQRYGVPMWFKSKFRNGAINVLVMPDYFDDLMEWATANCVKFQRVAQPPSQSDLS